MPLGPFLRMQRRERSTTVGANVTTTPLPFGWYRGLTILQVYDSATKYNWQIQFNGGEAKRSGWPGIWVEYVGDSCVDNSLDPLPVGWQPPGSLQNYYTVTTPVADAGGRIYTITFSSSLTTYPTIQVSGAPPASTLVVTSISYTPSYLM